MKQKRFDMIFKAHVLFSGQDGRLSYPNINANIPSLCRSGNPAPKYYFLLSEPWKPGLCIKHHWLLSSDINHKDYTGPFDEERRNRCWDSRAPSLLYHSQHGHRIRSSHRLRLNRRGSSEPLLRAKGRREFFWKGFRAFKMSFWSGLACRSDHVSPHWLQIQACIWPLHWKLAGEKHKHEELFFWQHLPTGFFLLLKGTLTLSFLILFSGM